MTLNGHYAFCLKIHARKFDVTLSYREWPFTLNSVLFLSTKVQNLLILTTIISIILVTVIDNIFGEVHMYTIHAISLYKLLNILRLGIFNSFSLLMSI